MLTLLSEENDLVLKSRRPDPVSVFLYGDEHVKETLTSSYPLYH